MSAGSLALAGCGTFESNPDGVVLSHITFFNRTLNEQTIRYQVTSEDRPIVEDAVTLQRHRGNADDYTRDTERRVHDELRDRKVYTIRYRSESETDWRQSYTFDGSEYTCLGLHVTIRDSGTSLYTGEIAAQRCPTEMTPTG